MTTKKTLPRLWHIEGSRTGIIWDSDLGKTWSWVDECGMSQLLRKEEETMSFRFARRIMSKRKGWMLKSRKFKSKTKPLRVGGKRVRACNYLFSSSWQKYYSVGMQRKRAAQRSWRRLRFWMKANPCLWKSLQKLNITISVSDLISVLDNHPEWFSIDGICLEAIRTPLRRLGLHISHVPLSHLPQQILVGFKEHGSKYLFWRMNNGVGHYAHDFKPGDLCFEITDYLWLRGDLSWVFGSAKEKKGLRTRAKKSSHSKLTTSRNSKRWPPTAPQNESSGIAERRRSERLHLKRPREAHGKSVSP